ncbi:hypothetical protein L1987_47176 [Smallanthus sonchifolius]|uniref:Uncharacterized protein n=1 Tax=Smallanthus sonchifolius TaxID=185202 RepID=A0ACB9G2S3_9ASTR|nr:hypothetical protein L1987_47176 [Smallanthus sonchifolius]
MAKKRALEAIDSQLHPSKKNRVVLGEISNNAASSRSQTTGNEIPNTKCKQKKVKKSAVKTTELFVEKISDPQMCEAYVADIHEYLHNMEMEAKRRPMPQYIEKVQKDVIVNMRGVLVDWLVEVAEEYKLLSETLYLTISYVDRFLSTSVLNRQRLQLLGVSSMLIAAKYEEISPPNTEDFCYITDNTYTKQEVVKMEADVLKALKFEMGNPTVKSFLRRLTAVAQEDYEVSSISFSVSSFMIDLVIGNLFTLKRRSHPWNLSLEKLSGYKSSDLKECVQILHDLQLSRRAGNLVAVREKYKQHKFKCVSKLSSPSTIPASFFDDLKQ